MRLRDFRFIFATVACVIVGPILVWRYFSALPALEDLEVVSGIVQFDTETSRGRYTKRVYPVMIIDQGPNHFAYPEWFPLADNITTLVRAGAPVTIWANKNDLVWQIEQDGRIIVPYSEIRDAVAANKRFDWIMGAVLFAGGLFGLFKIYRQFRNRNTAAEVTTGRA